MPLLFTCNKVGVSHADGHIIDTAVLYFTGTVKSFRIKPKI